MGVNEACHCLLYLKEGYYYDLPGSVKNSEK